MLSAEHFDVKFTSREVSAWGGLALLKKMMDGMGVFQAIQSWQLPMPGSNRGYAPAQLLEQMMVSIWCGALTQGACFAIKPWFNVPGFALACLGFMSQMKQAASNQRVKIQEFYQPRSKLSKTKIMVIPPLHL